MRSELSVFIDLEKVGNLWLDERKRFCFRYDEGWLETSRYPLSLSLPLRPDPYLDDEAHAFFANLLPEQKIREVIARNLGLSVGNDFGLLEKIGGDCAGAVSVYPAGRGPNSQAGGYRFVDETELERIVRSLPRKPLLAGEKEIRLSLAGAQKKLPVLYREGKFALGLGGSPSSHIIKPPMEELDGTVENEAFCMRLASRLGLSVPRSFIHVLGDLKLFVIERYDRISSPEEVKRLHQEDFCQSMNVLPEFKYESEGGPSLAQCFDLVRERSASPGRDVLALLNWVIFNFLIGNSDAHGKNLSLLFLPGGPVLTPFYDLLSTRIYAHYGLSEGMAMKIGGEKAPTAVRKEHWERLAEETRIKPGLVFRQVLALSKKIHPESLNLFKGEFQVHQSDPLHRLVEMIALNSEKTIRKLS